MKSAVIVVCSLISLNCSAQDIKKLSGDTTFWNSIECKKSSELKLPLLTLSQDYFHFRFWTDEQVIDIWTVDGKIYKGIITSYTRSYIEPGLKNKLKRTPKTFFKQDTLDAVLAKNAFELTKHIASIPSEKDIRGWQQGFDGIEYIIETSTPTTYNFRTYWTPSAQKDSLIEAKKILTFVNDLSLLLNLPNKFHNFFATLKPGAYNYDGPMVTIKLTKKQEEYYKRTKPYREYLESVSDTLNHYLSDTLTRLFAKYGGLKCYDEFLIKLSTSNRLLKITTNSELTDDDDKKEYRECKKKIAAAFKWIRFTFVHSKVAYWKKITFWEGKVNVFDAPNGGL